MIWIVHEKFTMVNQMNKFKCGYCQKVIENEYGNSSRYVVGKICNKCNEEVEIQKRLESAQIEYETNLAIQTCCQSSED